MSEVNEAAVVEQTLPDDFAAYRAARTGEVKPKEEGAEQAEAQPELQAEEPEGKTEPESDPEKTEQEQPRDEQGKFKPKDDELPAGVQKRIQKEIDKAVRARKEAEEFRNQAREEAAKRGTDPAPKPEQPAAPTSSPSKPPKLSDFEEVDAWAEATAAYLEERAVAKARAEAEKFTESKLEARDKRAADEAAGREQQKINEAWTSRVEDARKQHSDFDEVLDDVAFPDTPAIRAVQQAFYESETGAELLYHLAAHPEEATRLSKLTPTAALRELGKIEAGLIKPAQPAREVKPAVSNAPPPIRTVAPRAAAGSTRDPEKMDFLQYREWRKKNGK